jgi:hypothetical protein
MLERKIKAGKALSFWHERRDLSLSVYSIVATFSMGKREVFYETTIIKSPEFSASSCFIWLFSMLNEANLPPLDFPSGIW